MPTSSRGIYPISPQIQGVSDSGYAGEVRLPEWGTRAQVHTHTIQAYTKSDAKVKELQRNCTTFMQTIGVVHKGRSKISAQFPPPLFKST